MGKCGAIVGAYTLLPIADATSYPLVLGLCAVVSFSGAIVTYIFVNNATIHANTDCKEGGSDDVRQIRYTSNSTTGTNENYREFDSSKSEHNGSPNNNKNRVSIDDSGMRVSNVSLRDRMMSSFSITTKSRANSTVSSVSQHTTVVNEIHNSIKQNHNDDIANNTNNNTIDVNEVSNDTHSEIIDIGSQNSDDSLLSNNVNYSSSSSNSITSGNVKNKNNKNKQSGKGRSGAKRNPVGDNDIEGGSTQESLTRSILDSNDNSNSNSNSNSANNSSNNSRKELLGSHVDSYC